MSVLLSSVAAYNVSAPLESTWNLVTAGLVSQLATGVRPCMAGWRSSSRTMWRSPCMSVMTTVMTTDTPAGLSWSQSACNYHLVRKMSSFWQKQLDI